MKGIPALTAKIHMPSGQVVDHYDGHYELNLSRGDFQSSRHGTQLTSRHLVWYRLDDGYYTIRLSLAGTESNEVEIEVLDGIATPQQLVFEMTEQH